MKCIYPFSSCFGRSDSSPSASFWFALFLFILAIPVSAFGQALNSGLTLSDYTLTNWSEEDGPFPFGVYAIAQDRQGYLWLGTRTGLVRFDGSEFAVWKGRAPLPDDRVGVITTAKDGSLWLGFGTLGGVARIDGEDVTLFTSQDGVAAGDVNDIEEDSSGSIWVASHGGLSVFDGTHWRAVGSEAGLPNATATSIWSDAQHALWVSTSVGIYRRDASKSIFTLVDRGTGGELVADKKGQVWVTDSRQTFRQIGVPRTDDQRAERIGAGRVMLVDEGGALWVGTRGAGALRVPGSTEGLNPAGLERLTRRQGLISDELRTVFQDADGAIWLGSRRGLSRLSVSTIRAVDTEGDTDSFVAAVEVTKDGAVWTATANGLKRTHGEERRTFVEADGLPSRIVTALHEDRRGTLWIGTALGVVRLVGGQFIPLPTFSGNDLSEYQIRSITSEEDGTLWLCDQSRGLLRVKDGVLQRVGGSLGQQKAYAIHSDSADRIWIGYWEGGVAVWDHGNVSTYTSQQGLPQGSVNAFFEDRAGGMWVATDHALGRIDGDSVRTFNSNGLPHSAVVSMIEDTAGNLWIGMGHSLLRVDRTEIDGALSDAAHQIRYHLYGSEDGLPGTLGRPGMPSAAASADGRLWFLTSEGLAVVDPARLHKRPAPRGIRVTSVFADGQGLAAEGGAIDIPPGTARLSLQYSVLNLAASRARYRHQLEGFDQDWQDVGEQREVSYTNLPPGKYRFRVASQHEGAWLEAQAPFEVTMLPAFYQTKPFFALALTLLAFSAWFVWRRRELHIKREFNLVLAERTRVGREIHDTLLQSLVAVALEFDDISEQLDPAHKSLRKQVVDIRKRVEAYILEARQSISNLRSPMLVESDLVTALKRSTESAVGHGARLEFSVQGMARRLDPNLEEQLLRIGSEAVANAIRHGAATVIHMELRFDHSAVTLRVSDDGRGFDLEQTASLASNDHWGIAGMKERAQRVGAQLRLDSHPGAGTTVEAIVPHAPSH